MNVVGIRLFMLEGNVSSAVLNIAGDDTNSARTINYIDIGNGEYQVFYEGDTPSNYKDDDWKKYLDLAEEICKQPF